jgi:hypothetical protein
VRTLAIASASLAWLAGFAAPASAQAFVPPKGIGFVTIEFQGGIIKRHLTMTGPKDSGRVDSQSLITDFSLGLGGGFGVSVGLPAIEARYVGEKPHTLLANEVALHPNFTTLDDGVYHASLQDVHLEVRRQWNAGRFTVTPFAGTIVPSHSYEYLSHAAVGRHVRELQIGAYAAGGLPSWVPRTFFQAGYLHGFEQTIIDVPRQRDVVTLEGVHFVNARWRVYATASGQLTHGGIDIQVSARELHGLEYINHDRIARTDLMDVGGGTSFDLTARMSVNASVSKTVWGINGHAQWAVVNLGVSYAIGRGRASASSGGDPPVCHLNEDASNPLQKCVCLRK